MPDIITGEMKSLLQKNPASKVLERGYINVYSNLTPQERRQRFFKTIYKKQNYKWDESMIFLNKLLSADLSGREKVVDLGCGEGNYLIDENRRKIAWAVGIDVDKNSVSKNKCLDKIVISKARILPFNSDYFDVAISLWVIEHIDNPKLFFSEIYRVLKPGGKFYFVTPNYNFLPLRLFKLFEIDSINRFLNKAFFGRKKEDIFPTYYKANTVGQLNSLIKSNFRILCLRTNFDPGYTSFNSLTFWLTSLSNRLLERYKLTLSHPHILGVLEKV